MTETAGLYASFNAGIHLINVALEPGDFAPNPGTLLSQSSNTAAVRSTDTVSVVISKLDGLYLTQKGCTEKLAVNRPKDYLCVNPSTGKTDEVYFVFAALDPTAADPSRSQTTAHLIAG